MEEFKGQFESFNKQDGENKVSKMPISHAQMVAFKANSDLSTNSETSEEFRGRSQFGGDYEQKYPMESPNFQANSFMNKRHSDQFNQCSEGLFPPNNFLGSGHNKSGGDSISNRTPTLPSHSHILGSSNNSGGADTSSSSGYEPRKYEFKSKFDEYQMKNGQAPSSQQQNSQLPQQPNSLLFDRKGTFGGYGLGDTTTSINNENSKPCNPFTKSQRANGGGEGYGSSSQTSSQFDFGNKYRFNIQNESTKNSIQNTSSISGFSGQSNIMPNQVFDIGDESEKSYFKINSNLTPTRSNKNSGGLFSQAQNNSNNFGNFSNSFSHNNPMSLNSQNSSSLQEGPVPYGRKLSVDQFKRNSDFDNSINNRELSNESKLTMNNLRKVNYPQQQMPSNGFKSLGESRVRSTGMQMSGFPPSAGQNGQPPLKPPKYPGSAQKMGNQSQLQFEGNPAEIHQQMMNNQKMNNIMKKNSINIPTDILTYDQDYFPQYTMFLLAEEEKNISNFRERVEKEKSKIESDFDHMKHEMNNLLEDLKIEMTQGVDEHFKQFIERYKVFKTEVIDFKSIKSELPSMQAPPPSQIDQKNASNVQLIKELEELRYRNQMSKLYQYIGEIQKANINRILQASQNLLSQMSSSASLYNTEGCQKQFKELKNSFAQNLSQRFDPLTNFVRCVQGAPTSAGLELMNLNSSAVIPANMQQQQSPSQQYQFSAPHPLGNPPNSMSLPQSNFSSISQQNQQGQQPHGYYSDSPSRGMNDPNFVFPQNQMMQMNLMNHFNKQAGGIREDTPEKNMPQQMNMPIFGQQMPMFNKQRNLIGQESDEQFSQPFALRQGQEFDPRSMMEHVQSQSSQQSVQMQIPQYSQPFCIQNEDQE